MKIIIDIGHGGSDNGCNGFGKIEKNLNLQYGLALRDKLSKCKNVKVLVTRSSDIDVSLNARAKIFNLEKPDLVLSCHLNAFNGSARGTETIYSINADKKIVELAYNLGKNISNNLKIPLRRTFSRKSDKTGLDYYSVIRNCKNTIILEPFFLDNKQDA